jgi:hypothetical protein
MGEIDARTPHPIFFGLALVTIGVLFLLRELDVLPDIRVWTLLWLGLGGWLFVGTLVGRRKGWFWPLTLLAVGIVMLLQDLEHLDEGFRLWPVVIIAIGTSIMLEARGGRKAAETSPEQNWERWRDL